MDSTKLQYKAGSKVTLGSCLVSFTSDSNILSIPLSIFGILQRIFSVFFFVDGDFFYLLKTNIVQF